MRKTKFQSEANIGMNKRTCTFCISNFTIIRSSSRKPWILFRENIKAEHTDIHIRRKKINPFVIMSCCEFCISCVTNLLTLAIMPTTTGITNPSVNFAIKCGCTNTIVIFTDIISFQFQHLNISDTAIRNICNLFRIKRIRC